MCKTAPAAAAIDAEHDPADTLWSPTLGDIFRRYGPDYRRKYAGRMPREQLRVMALLEKCRTGALGSVLYRCPGCGEQQLVARSCGNRHCPQCQGHKARQWYDTQLQRLLPCPYFFLTFTVPSLLRPVIRRHPRQGYQALFEAAAETLKELASNPRHVGSSRLGLTGVLHTWTKKMAYHPHVHFLVPGGALDEEGQDWLPSRDNFFVPVRAASKIFRAKFRDRMKQLGLFRQIPSAVWTKEWIVHSQPVGDGRRALRYLAPYIYRVAITQRRIVKLEAGPDGLGRVTYQYRHKESKTYRPLSVTAEEFIRRFLQHVLPRGFQKVRHFGLNHPRCAVDREWLKMLVTLSRDETFVLYVMAPPLIVKHKPPCPRCGSEMDCVEFLSARDDWSSASALDTS